MTYYTIYSKDSQIKKVPIMNNLPLEKQLTHRNFCDAIENIEDIKELKHQISKLHLLYLSQQVLFAKMAKGCLH